MARITVLKNPVNVPDGKKYQVCELGYKTEDGKVKAMRIFGFGDSKPVFDIAKSAKVGDVLEAAYSQNDKGYWQFASLASTGESTPVASASNTPAARGNWETSEERAARQVMIVRQSSLSTAQAMLEANKAKAEASDVIEVAKQFEAYVMGKETVTGDVE